MDEPAMDSALRTAVTELRQILTITSRFPAEEISDGVTVALRALSEAAALVDPASSDAVEFEAIANAILAAEDKTALDPATGIEPDYALAFRGIDDALARLNAYLATGQVAGFTTDERSLLLEAISDRPELVALMRPLDRGEPISVDEANLLRDAVGDELARTGVDPEIGAVNERGASLDNLIDRIAQVSGMWRA